MFKVGFAVFFVIFSGVVLSEQLTIERIYQQPSLLGESRLKGLKISPDGRYISYLQEKKEKLGVYDLWAFDTSKQAAVMLVDSASLIDGKETLTEAEKAKRERKRITSSGIIEYAWHPKQPMVMFPYNGDIYTYILDDKNKPLKNWTNSDSAEENIKFSGSGKHLAFTRDDNLHALNLESGKTQQLTFRRKDHIKVAVAEFVAQEEMKRFDGYWWSPDGSKIAYVEFDESPVQIEQRYEIDDKGVKVFEQRYPATGTANVRIKLMVLELASKQRHQLDLGTDPDIYLARVNWFPDSEHVAVQRQSRDQKQLDLIKFDYRGDKPEILLTERSETWVNLHDDLRFLKETPHFIWSSERSGFRQLYLYANTGELIRPLTQGQGVVLDLAMVDEKAKSLYFHANYNAPLEQHLYSTSLEQNAEPEVKQITSTPGWHDAVMSAETDWYIRQFTSVKAPYTATIESRTKNATRVLRENKLDAEHPYYPYMDAHVYPEFGSIKASDGQSLYYRLYKPKDGKGKKHPVVIDVYGGPGVQRVKNHWGSRNHFWHQYMVQQGFVVFSLDNRGSTNRGVAFEAPIYGELGKVELEDQMLGVNFLKSQDFVDPKRIGIFGWSYGGYMTLMAMLKEPDTFRVGVSVAPVTDWLLYDTHYTERYLKHPKENQAGYDRSNVLNYSENLKGSLLVVHGMADDNVLFSHSTLLFSALQKEKLPFDMMTYPGSKHGISEKHNRVHLFNYLSQYFMRNLR